MNAAKERALATVAIASTLACHVTYRVSPGQYVPANAPAEITVRDNTGVVYAIERPTVVGEKLQGIDLHTGDTVSLPLSRVEEALVTRRSNVRTAILVGSLTAVTGAAVLLERGGKGDSCKLISDKEDVVGKGTLCEEISDPTSARE